MESKVNQSQSKKKSKALALVQKALAELENAYEESPDKRTGDVICTLETAERELNNQI